MIYDLVTTIIPVHNRAGMLRQAVQSVILQSWPYIEIIIVDDGSTDETCFVADDLAQQYPDIIRVLHIENSGAGLARETGRQVARGEFIQYLDSDDLLLPVKFAVQVAALREHTECGIAYGISRLVDEGGTVLKAPYKWTGLKFDELFPALLIDRWWNTHTPLFRRSVCDQVGAWTNMRMSEDWEYEARVGSFGIRLVHCPIPCSDTRRHSGERLTNQLDPLVHSRDMARLIKALYVGATKVRVDTDSPEMKHFSRWAFLEARRAGAAGLSKESRECLEIAECTDAGRTSKQFMLYRTAARMFGWCAAGRLSLLRDGLRHSNLSGQGLPLSWSDN